MLSKLFKNPARLSSPFLLHHLGTQHKTHPPNFPSDSRRFAFAPQNHLLRLSKRHFCLQKQNPPQPISFSSYKKKILLGSLGFVGGSLVALGVFHMFNFYPLTKIYMITNYLLVCSSIFFNMIKPKAIETKAEDGKVQTITKVGVYRAAMIALLFVGTVGYEYTFSLWPKQSHLLLFGVNAFLLGASYLTVSKIPVFRQWLSKIYETKLPFMFVLGLFFILQQLNRFLDPPTVFIGQNSQFPLLGLCFKMSWMWLLQVYVFYKAKRDFEEGKIDIADTVVNFALFVSDPIFLSLKLVCDQMWK